MTIKEMDEAYSNLKTEYFSIQDELTTARQCMDCDKKDILKLQKQLKIAIEALSRYANSSDWWDCESNGAVQFVLNEGGFEDYGYKIAQEAIKQIKELDE